MGRSVRVTDPDGGFTDGNLTIRVVNDNDNTPVINNPQLQGTTRILHSESSHLVMDLKLRMRMEIIWSLKLLVE